MDINILVDTFFDFNSFLNFDLLMLDLYSVVDLSYFKFLVVDILEDIDLLFNDSFVDDVTVDCFMEKLVDRLSHLLLSDGVIRNLLFSDYYFALWYSLLGYMWNILNNVAVFVRVILDFVNIIWDINKMVDKLNFLVPDYTLSFNHSLDDSLARGDFCFIMDRINGLSNDVIVLGVLSVSDWDRLRIVNPTSRWRCLSYHVVHWSMDIGGILRSIVHQGLA